MTDTVKKILISLSLFLSSQLFAESIIGEYSMPRGGPDSMSPIYTFYKEGDFTIIAYGTLIGGKWQIKNQNVVLTPYNPPMPFTVMGRYNPSVKKGIQIDFQGGYMYHVYAGTFPDAMKQVWNDTANCFEPKYANLPIKNNSLDLIIKSSNDIQQNPDWLRTRYTFSPGHYNDLIIHYTARYLPEETLIIQNGQLQDQYHNVLTKQGSDTSEENKKFKEEIRQLFLELPNQKIRPAFYSENHNELELTEESPNFKNYRFDPKSNAYIFKPIRKQSDTDHDYQENAAIYKYHPVKVKTAPLTHFSPQQGSWLSFNCTDYSNTDAAEAAIEAAEAAVFEIK